MMAHVYRVGESDTEGLHESTTRTTMRPGFRGINEPCLILGTLPHVTVIKMKDIRWFWVEED